MIQSLLPPKCGHRAVLLLTLVGLFAFPVRGRAQELAVEMIFGGTELTPEALPEMAWSPDGDRLTFISTDSDSTTDLVALDLSSGEQQIVVDGSTLIAPGERMPIAIEAYQWSPDARTLLIYTRSERVWRDNTKGVYFTYGLDERILRPVSTRFGYQMFAKFSPDGGRVGFVRDKDLFVTDLNTGRRNPAHGGWR